MIDLTSIQTIVQHQCSNIFAEVQWIEVCHLRQVVKSLLMIQHFIGNDSDEDKKLHNQIRSLLHCLTFNRLEQVNLFITDFEYFVRCLEQTGYLKREESE